jgi:nucleoid-associated protein YgaU
MTVADMSAAIGALDQMQALVALAGYLGRIGANFGAVSQSGATVVTAGGDLIAIAAAQYGQAQAWTTIAAANDLSDPVIQGVQTLKVPSTSDQNDGVLES